MYVEERSGTEVKKSGLKRRITSRVRFRPGDHFSKPCTIHLPDCFSKIEEDRSVKPISPSSPPVLDLSKRILYSDDHLLVLNKPAGVCCQVVPFPLLQRSPLQTRSSASTPFCSRCFHPASSTQSIVLIALSSLFPFTLGHHRRAADSKGQRNGQNHRNGVGAAQCRQNLHRCWVRSRLLEEATPRCWNHSLAPRPCLECILPIQR